MGLIFVIIVMFAPEGLTGIFLRHARLNLASWRRLMADYTAFLFACVGLVLSGVWMTEVSYRLMGTSPIVGLAPDGTITFLDWTFSAASSVLWSTAIAVFAVSLFESWPRPNAQKSSG
ncbi:hypothetical protein ACF1BQ_031020 [Bradyrhizobium sp. RDT10]